MGGYVEVGYGPSLEGCGVEGLETRDAFIQVQRHLGICLSIVGFKLCHVGGGWVAKDLPSSSQFDLRCQSPTQVYHCSGSALVR